MRDDIPIIRAEARANDIPRHAYRAYLTQRRNAARRGIPFLFTLTDWWQWWQANGWRSRGRRKGQSVMARIGDKGAYEAGNIYATTADGNLADANRCDPDAWGEVDIQAPLRTPW